MLTANGESIMGAILNRDITSKDYPDARKLLDKVKASRGSDCADIFACHMMDVALAFLIDRHGAGYTLYELANSVPIQDALARSAARKNR
jgi:hypothetical protein